MGTYIFDVKLCAKNLREVTNMSLEFLMLNSTLFKMYLTILYYFISGMNNLKLRYDPVILQEVELSYCIVGVFLVQYLYLNFGLGAGLFILVNLL